MQTSKKKKI